MGSRVPMTGRTRFAAIIGQTEAATAWAMAALPCGPLTGRARSVVPMTCARLVSSLPRLSSAFTPPCMPMTISWPSVASASILRSR